MAPKRTRNKAPSSDPHGIFAGMVVFLIENGVQSRRLQIWQQKLVQMGAKIETHLSKKVSHVFAMSSDALFRYVDKEQLARFGGHVLMYQWLEDSLAAGEKVSEDFYILKVDLEGVGTPDKNLKLEPANRYSSSHEEQSHCKNIKSSPEHTEHTNEERKGELEINTLSGASNTEPHSPSSLSSYPEMPGTPDKDRARFKQGHYRDIWETYKHIQRSFSYYKAIAVVEKLPFKIESSNQVKNLPGIGKSMQDHIQEIVTTGKLSKLEHFETDEKVRTISIFGEVWGIGPATALKLYEKGHRTLDDLKNEDSLTNAQKLGLKYFDDIKTRIPRHEAQEMESLLQKVAVDIVPGVVVVCGGSYRRGKASCGDLDIVITHPDGKSHKGFLQKYVKRLKEMKFLREDLVFSTHSEEGTDSGVDTYFGLCTYPGRELRHRIDFKVYPRDIYAFGLIAWTGNDVLNRRLRLLAESKGYRLDDTGLFPATHGSGGKRGARGTTSLKMETEKEVFDFLGFPWLEPYERNL
ncbi:DNA polymerase lambda isoform X2 [Herrania umbratica]|uniref:DNA polymerase n=1 Tax=Herrania umbratica TaxID=108875 RepID=A0A6J1B475_9ROSI|nr:DNA polymerase lambda isoform X2 [Herrania umbratica]